LVIDYSNPFTKRFRFLVTSSGVKKVEVAKLLQTSRSTVQRWMVGAHVPPKAYQQILLMKLEAFVGYSSNQPQVFNG
jgi:DNA-binding transcriptional regulator YiaG